jgi:putative endonuclease
MSRREGSRYEQMAGQFLQQHGCFPLLRNYNCRGGEIDLIMRDGQTLCFVEVKFRKNAAFGGTAYSITRSKQQRILLCARHYIASHPQHQQMDYRFDVVLVQPGAGQELRFEWLKSAFDATE